LKKYKKTGIDLKYFAVYDTLLVILRLPFKTKGFSGGCLFAGSGMVKRFGSRALMDLFGNRSFRINSAKEQQNVQHFARLVRWTEGPQPTGASEQVQYTIT
jgi:hypothetical protein